MSLKMFDSYHRQDFSLPATVIYYLTRNPSSPNGYRKLIETCKYFFAKNPILPLKHFRFSGRSKWSAFYINKYNRKTLKINDLKAKIWMNYAVFVYPTDVLNFISSIIPKVFQCNILKLTLLEVHTTYDELLFLSSAKKCSLYKITVTSENGETIPFEGILPIFAKATHFDISLHDNPSSATANTATEILKIPQFYKFRHFELFNISESFNIEDFFDYLKTNISTGIFLKFSSTLSEEYKNRLGIIVDKFLEIDFSEYSIPRIYYPGINIQKKVILDKRQADSLRKYDCLWKDGPI